MQLNSWFQAASSRDVSTILRLRPKHQGVLDARASCPESGVFKGFTALHYACYNGSILVAQELLDGEIQIRTDEAVEICAPGIAAGAKFELPRGSSCLQIALLRRKESIIRLLLEYCSAQQLSMADAPNDAFQNVLFTASLCDYPEARRLIGNPLCIREMNLCASMYCPVRAALRQGHVLNLNKLQQVFTAQGEYLDKYRHQVLSSSSGTTLIGEGLALYKGQGCKNRALLLKVAEMTKQMLVGASADLVGPFIQCGGLDQIEEADQLLFNHCTSNMATQFLAEDDGQENESVEGNAEASSNDGVDSKTQSSKSAEPSGSSAWFQAAASGNMKTLSKLKAEFAGTIQEESGLYAIHIATLQGHADAVVALLESEGLLSTMSELPQKANGIYPDYDYAIPKNSTCLHIALLTGQGAVITSILSAFLRPELKFVAYGLTFRKNGAGLSCLSTAYMCGLQEAFAIIRHSVFQVELFQHNEFDTCPATIATRFCRLQYLVYLCSLDKDVVFRSFVYKMLLGSKTTDDKTVNIITLALENIGSTQFGGTLSDHLMILKQTHTVSQYALKFAQGEIAQGNMEWKTLIDAYLGGKGEYEFFEEAKQIYMDSENQLNNNRSQQLLNKIPFAEAESDELGRGSILYICPDKQSQIPTLEEEPSEPEERRSE